MKIRFLRVNERHHSIAIANFRGLKFDPIRTKVQHVNIQADSLDHMVSSYQRVPELGFRMAWSVGQDTNSTAYAGWCHAVVRVFQAAGVAARTHWTAESTEPSAGQTPIPRRSLGR